MKKNTFITYLILATITSTSFFGTILPSKTEDQHALATEMHSDYYYLSYVIENTAILVDQMEFASANETQIKKIIKIIDNSFKKLSSSTKNEVRPLLDTIKKEAQSFYSSKESLKKFDVSVAREAFNKVVAIITKIMHDNDNQLTKSAQAKLTSALNKAERIINKSSSIIEKTQELLADNKISAVKAARIIGKEHYTIQAAQRTLKTESQLAQNVVNQTSYIGVYAAHAHAIGSSIIAPFKAGYGYTQQEKEIAYAIIEQLEAQLLKETNKFNETVVAHAADSNKIAQAKQSFENVVQQIYNEIHQQKLITGQVMSKARKLFWSTVTTAGALTAGSFGYRYLTSQQNTPTVNTLLDVIKTDDEVVSVARKEEKESRNIINTVAHNAAQNTPQQNTKDPVDPAHVAAVLPNVVKETLDTIEKKTEVVLDDNQAKEKQDNADIEHTLVQNNAHQNAPQQNAKNSVVDPALVATELPNVVKETLDTIEKKTEVVLVGNQVEKKQQNTDIVDTLVQNNAHQDTPEQKLQNIAEAADIVAELPKILVEAPVSVADSTPAPSPDLSNAGEKAPTIFEMFFPMLRSTQEKAVEMGTEAIVVAQNQTQKAKETLQPHAVKLKENSKSIGTHLAKELASKEPLSTHEFEKLVDSALGR